MDSNLVFADEKKIPENVEMYIKNLIISGKLAPGERIDEKIFADKLEIGVTSVRSAFSSLCYDDYISSTRGVGYRVSALTVDDVKNLYYLSYTLMKASFKSICYSTSMITLLNESIVRTKDMTDFDAERKFHVTVALASRNREFINSSIKIYDKLQWWSSCHSDSDMYSQEILDEHRAITDMFIKYEYKNHFIFDLIDKHYEHHLSKLG